MVFLDGSIGSDFETRYVGTTFDEASAGEASFRKYISSKIAGSLEDAVNSF